MARWQQFILALGAVFLAAAVGLAIRSLALGDVSPAVALDVVLISVPGVVLLHVGRWLPDADIEPAQYPRIVAWGAGGVAVLVTVIFMRALHPGVSANFSFGTTAVSVAIGSIAGIAIGVREAQATTRAKRLARQYEELRRAQAVERKNEQLKRTQAKLEEANEKLCRSNERLEQFAHAASHDLQEPLRMVRSYLQLLDRRYGDELDEDAEEFIEYAADGADRMRAMIEGLLAYSRVEAQGDPFDAVDLNDVLDDVLRDLQLKIEESAAEIEREPLPTVRGDAGQLGQLFQNLVRNAIDYSVGRSRVHVSVAREGPRWVVSVRDEGVGIDSADADRVFDIFQRVGETGPRGSGIGLALCKRIVERHGGEIWVDSEPGEGSTFRFSLPAGTEKAPAADAVDGAA